MCGHQLGPGLFLRVSVSRCRSVKTAGHKPDRTIKETPVANCAISAATNSISRAKSERVANELILVRRAQRGDEEAFATLFQVHRSFVYSVCLSMMRDASEAEDLTQEAFLQA